MSAVEQHLFSIERNRATGHSLLMFGFALALWNSTCSVLSSIEPQDIVCLCLILLWRYGTAPVQYQAHPGVFAGNLTSSGSVCMCTPKTFTLEVTAEELVLIETALLGLVQAREHNDALFLLLQRVHSLRPLPFVTPPTPTSSVRAGSASLSQSPTRFSPESPGSSSHTTLASFGSPLPVVADQTSAEEENLDWEMVVLM